MTRPVNEQKIMNNAIRAISWIQFINLGLVLLMLNISIKGFKKLKLPAGILQGDFDDISAGWYLDVGTQILFNMLLEIGAPHAIPFLQLAYFGIRRCLDRGCTCDQKKSKKLLQSEYEELYIGPEFLLDSRLA